MAFWIVAGFVGLAVAGLLALALFRRDEAAPPEAVSDVQVYRDQLHEVKRDLARGVLSAEEAERVRVEVSRRLLEADRKAQAAQAAPGPSRAASMAGGAALVAALAGSFALYWMLGQPGYGDLPLKTRLAAAEQLRAERPDQETIEADVAGRRLPPDPPDARTQELMTLLREAVAENPMDERGLELLATYEARLGDYPAAYAAQARLVELRGDAASGTDYAELASLMIEAAGGYVSPQAEAALVNALERDPSNGMARYHYGWSFLQTDRPDLAFRIWTPLFAESPPDAPWVAPLREILPEVARMAGTRWSPPPARGPTAEDMEAAADMTPEERLGMIRGMVNTLSDRLATEGGSPEEWAQLISSLGVLGESAEAAAIWTEARTVFADLPEALATVRAAAERAGVAE